MHYICTSLKTCDSFNAISFSKNNLGIDDFEETQTE